MYIEGKTPNIRGKLVRGDKAFQGHRFYWRGSFHPQRIARAKAWTPCFCSKVKTDPCQSLYEANSLNLQVTSRCLNKRCGECGTTRFLYLKDVEVHGHLELDTRKKRTRVRTTRCIPEGHFITCVRWLSSPEATTSNVIDGNGYIWAATKIKAGEYLSVSMDLGSLVVEFDRYKRHFKQFEAKMFLELFDEEKGKNYTILDYIIDHPEKFPRSIINKYIPLLAESEVFQKKWRKHHSRRWLPSIELFSSPFNIIHLHIHNIHSTSHNFSFLSVCLFFFLLIIIQTAKDFHPFGRSLILLSGNVYSITFVQINMKTATILSNTCITTSPLFVFFISATTAAPTLCFSNISNHTERFAYSQ